MKETTLRGNLSDGTDEDQVETRLENIGIIRPPDGFFLFYDFNKIPYFRFFRNKHI